jgi:hypothetical protein
MENATPQPGQVIAPTSSPAPGAPPQSPKKPAASAAAPATAAPIAAPPAAVPPEPAPTSTPVQPAPQTTVDKTAIIFQTSDTENQTAEDSDVSDTRTFSWSASEFVAHEKSAGWYLTLGVAALIIAALIFLLTRDFVSVGVVVVSAVILGVYGARRPRQLDYQLDDNGVTIGQKHHYYDEFRSFMIMSEGAFSSIVLMPHKRFAVPLTIYYPPEEEDDIVGILADQLPSEEGKRDAVDHLLHRIRF